MRVFLFFSFKNHFKKCCLFLVWVVLRGGWEGERFQQAPLPRLWLAGPSGYTCIPKGSQFHRSSPKCGSWQESPGRVTSASAHFPPESDVTGQWCGLGIGALQSSQAVVLMESQPSPVTVTTWRGRVCQAVVLGLPSGPSRGMGRCVGLTGAQGGFCTWRSSPSTPLPPTALTILSPGHLGHLWLRPGSDPTCDCSPRCQAKDAGALACG